MKIFKITFNEYGYDQYDSFVIAAYDKKDIIPFLESKYDHDNYGVIDVKGGYIIEEIKPNKYKQITEISGSFNAG